MRIPLIAVLTLGVLANTIPAPAQTRPTPKEIEALWSIAFSQAVTILTEKTITSGINMGNGEVVTTRYPSLAIGSRVLMNGFPGTVIRVGGASPSDPSAHLVLLKWNDPRMAFEIPLKTGDLVVGMMGFGLDFTTKPARTFKTKVQATPQGRFATLSPVESGSSFHGIGFYAQDGSLLGIILGARAMKEPKPEEYVNLALIPIRNVMAFLHRERPSQVI